MGFTTGSVISFPSAVLPVIFVLFHACFTNSNTPNMLPWSVMAIARILSRMAFLYKLFMEAAPSSNEYCVCTCRCAYEGIEKN